jgi:CRISPR-associated protein Csh1
MLEAIKHIGELERISVASNLNALVLNLTTKKNYSHILLLMFEVVDGKVVRYTGTSLEEIDSTKKLQYLYSKGSGSNGTDITPTSLITEPQKTLRVKLDAWIKNNARDSSDDFLKSLATVYDRDHEHIVADVLQVDKEKTGKKGYVLSLAFDDMGIKKYIGDYPVFCSFIEKKVTALGNISHKEHVCSVCGKIKPIVYGDVSPGALKFYTLDKPGYIASGFEKQSSWKNFPICTDCALDIEVGTKYVDEHLNFKLGGASYYLIPKLVFNNETLLRRIEQEFRQQEKVLSPNNNENDEKATMQKKFEAERQAGKNIERFILATMGKQNSMASFDLLFYDKPQQGTFKILQRVQSVVPGRAAAIVTAMRNADSSPIFENALFVDGGRQDLEFSFWQLAQFFKKQKSTKDQTWKQEYLAIVANIFTGTPVGKDYIIHQIMQKLRDELLNNIYNNQGKTFSFEEWTLRAFNTLLFLQGSHAIATNYGEVRNMDESTEVSAQLFDGNKAVDTPAKKAIFLTGVLTQYLLNIQWQERKGNKPFFKELKGLRLKEQDIKGLFPKIINKLEEYGRNYYVKLEQETALQFAEAGNNWDLTIDEINFNFSLGMTLATHINKKETNNGTDKQN